MYAAFVYGSFSFLAIACVYFLLRLRIRHVFYSGVILLTLLQIVGAFFKVIHWTGGDQLLMLGFSGTIIGGGLLIWKAVRNSRRQVMFNKLALGIILLLQIAFMLFPSPQTSRLAPLLHYPIVALAATVIVNDQTEHDGEKNMLMLFLMQSVFYIVVEILKRF